MKNQLSSITLLMFFPVLIFSHENTLALCTDGLDNDNDGFIDCLDSECEAFFNQSCDECIETPLILTGQNQIGSLDPNWEVSNVFSESPTEIPVADLPPPDAANMVWTQASVVAPCSPNWIVPQSLPNPLNQANWITHPDDDDCETRSTTYSHYYYRTKVNLPCSCGGQPVTIDSVYTITIDAYVDNMILAVYVNGELQDIPTLPGGSFNPGGQVQIEINGGWLPDENTLAFLVRNQPGTLLDTNPEGFLAVLSQSGDSDNDGINDFQDLCLCEGQSIVDTNFVFSTTCNPMDTGIVVKTLLTDYGCDSTIVFQTNYLPLDTFFVYDTTCDSLSVGLTCETLTSSNGCDSVSCVDLVFATLPIVEVMPEFGTISLRQDIPINLKIIQGGDMQISWSNSESLDCSDCLSVIASPNETTEYRVTVTDSNGCEAIGSSLIEVTDADRRIFIPNAFSPNYDGINDYFTLFAEPNTLFIESLRIFDRWGTNVYEKFNFEPNIPFLGWDGTLGGQEMDPGVFYFFAEIKWMDGHTELIEGDVSLIK